MKVKFKNLSKDEKLFKNKKEIKVGDIVELSDERAKHYIAQDKAEQVKEQPKNKPKKDEKSE